MIYPYEKFCNLDNLKREIEQSFIVIALEGISGNANATQISFKSELSVDEKTMLDSIVNDHDASKPSPRDPLLVKIPENLPSTNTPYASKRLQNGLKLFRRLHGQEYSVEVGANTLEFACPYPHAKITGLEIINCASLEKANFTVHDSENGTYTSYPKFELNQFGFDVYLRSGSHEHVCKYDADLYLGMIVRLVYTSLTAKDIAVNFYLDEVKE